MREPLLLPLVFFSLGIITARFAQFHPGEIAALAGALTVLCALAAWKAARLSRAPGLMLVAVAGLAVSGLHRAPKAPELDAEGTETLLVSGCVVEPPETAHGRERFILELEPGAR